MAVKFKRNENLSIEELEKENEKLIKEHAALMFEIKKIDKKAVGLLWLLWLIPIIGWIFYSIFFARRRQSEEYLSVMIPVKEKLAMNELQRIQNNVWIEKKQEANH